MSHEELYQEAKQETISYLQHANNLFQQWQLASGKDPARQEQLREKINEAVMDATDRVNELAESNEIVEKHRHKFAFSDEELESRKQFVIETQRTLMSISRAVQQGSAGARGTPRGGGGARGPGTPGGSIAASKAALTGTDFAGNDTRQRLVNELRSDNDNFLETQMQQQQRIESDRDRVVDQLRGNIAEIGEMGRQMGHEIDHHLEILDDLGKDMDSTEGRLERHIKRVGELIDQSSNTSVLIVIIILVLILLGMVALLFL